MVALCLKFAATRGIGGAATSSAAVTSLGATTYPQTTYGYGYGGNGDLNGFGGNGDLNGFGGNGDLNGFGGGLQHANNFSLGQLKNGMNVSEM